MPTPSIYRQFLTAEDGGFENRISFPYPCFLVPREDADNPTLTGVAGGLRITYRPDSGDTTFIGDGIPAGFAGAIQIWQKGYWWINVERWGSGATGQITVPFVVYPMLDATATGFFSSLGVARRALYTAPTITNVNGSVVSLTQMLEGIVAIEVQPAAAGVRLRFGQGIGATQFKLVTTGTTYVFKQEELPLAELYAQSTAASDTLRIIRYIR